MEIDINITLPPKDQTQADDPQRPEVWPTLLSEDEILSFATIEFFDAATKPKEGDPSVYEPIRDWGGAISEKSSHSFAVTGALSENSCGTFYTNPTTFHLHYIGNSVLVSPDVIQREFGQDNSARWTRMPIKTPASSHRDSSKRWTVEDNEYNIRCQLKRDYEGKEIYDLSPDLFKDGKRKGGGTIMNSDKATKYNWPSAKPGRFGIKIEEVGTKSIAHFLNKPSTESMEYSVDWFEPFGIFFCPFDTTDSQNIKVTREPRSDADEIDGKFLSVVGQAKIKIFMIPRRWAFWCRLGTKESAPEQLTFLTHTYSYEYQYIGGTLISESCTETPDPCSTDMGSVCGAVDCGSCPKAGVSGLAYGCSGYHINDGCGWGTPWGPSDIHVRDTTTYSWNGSNCVESYNTEWIGYPPNHCDPNTFPGSNVHYFSEIRGIWTRDRTIHMYMGLWWDRWPLGLKANAPQGETTAPTFYWKPSPEAAYQTYTVPLLGDESFATAQVNSLAAGDDQGSIDKKIIGGFNSFHVYSGTPNIEMAVLSSTGNTKQGLIWRSVPDGGQIPAVTVYGTSDFDDLNTRLIWDYIENYSEFWDTHKQYRTAANSYIKNSVPYGAGVSPNKAGDLIGIVTVNNKPFFIWRKTNEQFSEKLLKIQGNYSGHFVGFEGDLNYLDTDFDDREVIAGVNHQFSGMRRRMDKIFRTFSAPCFANPDASPVQRSGPSCWGVPQGDGIHELERPIYLLFSREHGFQTPHSGYYYDGLRAFRDLTQNLYMGITPDMTNRR